MLQNHSKILNKCFSGYKHCDKFSLCATTPCCVTRGERDKCYDIVHIDVCLWCIDYYQYRKHFFRFSTNSEAYASEFLENVSCIGGMTKLWYRSNCVPLAVRTFKYYSIFYISSASLQHRFHSFSSSLPFLHSFSLILHHFT